MPQAFPSNKLQPYLGQIRIKVPASQAILFCANNWNTQTLSKNFQQLLKAIPALSNGCITRQDVVQIGLLANQGKISWDAFFLAVMIWGFGTVGYGPWRTQKMFQTANFQTIYSDIRTHIQHGNILKAYKSAKISYCGPPFFTKLFYFLGKVFKSSPLPVILDSRVSGSLVKCNWNNFDGSIYFKNKGASRFGNGYLNYVTDVNQWSQANGFAVDQLEFFLFCPPIGF
jgi:hypothetical protein